jgi:peptidoglycan-N-acetylglucosamine deacetylase
MLWLVIAGFATILLTHTAPFPFLLERFAPSASLWHMPRTDPPTVYLTYDDGPNPTATPVLLDLLQASGTPATFFLIEAHLTEATAPLVRRMFAEGHAVALHSNTRRLMIETPTALARALTSYADRIEQLAGMRPCRLFRPHAGWRSGSMYEGLKQIDHRLVGWSWGLWDWNWYRPREARSLAQRLVRRVSRGDIVVMHDGHHVNPAADRTYAVEATRQLIPALTERGFGFGRLCQPSSSTQLNDRHGDDPTSPVITGANQPM